LWSHWGTRPNIGVCGPRTRGVALRQVTAFEDAFHDAAAEHGKSALRYGFADRRCNHGPDSFLHLWVFALCGFGMLQQSGNQSAFLRAENPLVPH
jgi:hypothetical protein